MNTKRLIKSGMLAMLFLILAVSLAFAQALPGTAFTYQGQLKSEGQPYTGTCDFRFVLYHAPSEGTPLGNLSLTEVSLTEGYFTVQLDFGATTFTGEPRWLDISVRCPAGTGDYTQLQPRQELTPAPYALHAINNWSVTGNAGTTPGTNYLGTSDNQALEIKVNGQRAFRFEPNTTSPNLIGGYSGNAITAGVYGATISGGGASGDVNSVTDTYGSIGGGGGNQAGNADADITNATYAMVAGGLDNTASGICSAIGGGDSNIASGNSSVIGGGYLNTASGVSSAIGGGYSNTASAPSSAIGGGYSNTASGGLSAIGGGDSNTASGSASVVAGGYKNTASASGGYSAIGGGYENTASGNYSAIGGGDHNTASANYATVSGGGPSNTSDPSNTNNKATDNYCTIGGGGGNQAGDADADLTNAIYATVAGGYYNTASGDRSAIGGGGPNTASGGGSAISGGSNNIASGERSAISGGYVNTASGFVSAIGGGYYNTASADYATVSGGGPSNTSDPSNTNNKATDNYCTIGGGGGNQAGNADANLTNATYATVAGGYNNTASGSFSAIVGGSQNLASGGVSFIGSGFGNTASGSYSTVLGGYNNTASGMYSFAAGRYANAATDGSFVWADPQESTYQDHGANTFNVRAKNGAFIDAATISNPGLNVSNKLTGTSAGQGTAVLGLSYSDNGYGLAGWNYYNGVGVGAWSFGGKLIEAYYGDFPNGTLRFYVDNAGNVHYDGAMVPYVAIPSPTGGAPSYVSLYGLAAAEAWYEDLGSSSLVSGKVNVSIDPLFAQTVTLTEDYQVQVTATCNEPVLLYVSEKTTTYFTVQGVRLDGKPSNCAFDYRISAKAVGYETVRLEAVDIPEPITSKREE